MTIAFPEIRARLRVAVESLCDEELHNRLWVRGDRRNDGEMGFDDAMLVVIDELEAFTPSELVGDVLRDRTELVAFQRLAAALDELVRVIGQRGTFDDALASGAPWRQALTAARSLDSAFRQGA